MNITYEKNGDYLIPNLISDPEPEGELRKFGLMKRHYLKEHRSGIYQAMLLSGKLKEHLFMMQEQAEAQFDLLASIPARARWGVVCCKAAAALNAPSRSGSSPVYSLVFRFKVSAQSRTCSSKTALTSFCVI